MSHRPERIEKDCLNCGAEVYGKYCHVCGQENVEPKETFWELVTHFVYDITHFDGKFFGTLKYLLFRPGLLSLEYIRGRRMRYLHPIKMYVFTSAIFFIFFFSMFNAADSFKSSSPKDVRKTRTKIEAKKNALQKILKDSSMPIFKHGLIEKEIELLAKDLETLKKDTTHLQDLNYNNTATFTMLGETNYYRTADQYDSIQRQLPAKKKDGWFIRQVRYKEIQIKNKYGSDKRTMIISLLDRFFHFFPQVLFVSLPIFAFLLWLLYIRRKKDYYYADHAIYSLHLYCAMFVMLFVYISLSKLGKLPYMSWLGYVTTIVVIYMFWYVYRSMRKFYQQRRAKTIFKNLILMFFSFIMMMFLFVVFFMFSIFAI